MKILVAEDNLISRELLKKHLLSWGYEVLAVTDGLAARAVLLGASPPQLSLVDWMMPKLEGLDLIRECRSLPMTARHHFILLSGRDSKEDVSLGLEAGADDYITKPYDTLELKARVAVGVRMAALRGEVAVRDDLLGKVKDLAGAAGGEGVSRDILELFTEWNSLQKKVA